jgi:hypothetical protein
MRLVADQIHGLGQRPHYEPAELDREFEKIVSSHLRRRHGSPDRAVSTDDLAVLVEDNTDELDLYADLAGFGEGVEGVTSFRPGSLPTVLISNDLGSSEHRENRLRTTLAHEFGHVHLHRYIIDLAIAEKRIGANTPIACKRETIVSAPRVDWREWQAGYACGAVLMPARRLRQKVADWQWGWKGEAADAGHALISEMAKIFQVSRLAAEVRLRVLGLVPQGQIGQRSAA